jgi:hypothetical protein
MLEDWDDYGDNSKGIKLPSRTGMCEFVQARHEEAIRRDPRTGEDMVQV